MRQRERERVIELLFMFAWPTNQNSLPEIIEYASRIKLDHYRYDLISKWKSSYKYKRTNDRKRGKYREREKNRKSSEPKSIMQC